MTTLSDFVLLDDYTKGVRPFSVVFMTTNCSTLRFQFMTICSPQVFTILGEEFEYDELRDIESHGMSAGFSGFIYRSELEDKFNKHEDEIMTRLDEFCDDCFNQSACAYIAEQLSFDDSHWTTQEFKEFAVWMYAELLADEYINDQLN